jgi:Flp pilus assembly protein TadD
VALKAINFDPVPVRVAALAVTAIVVLIAIFGFIWGLANSASLGADQKEVGVLLAELSPSDPQTHFASAILHEKTFEPGDIPIALAEYEKAAAISPNNYLIWLELGSALGRAGETAKAEAALRRARELAPNYARVHWALGNLLLRQGSDDEAYSELRQAIEGDPTFAAPAAAIAFQMADGDPKAVQSHFQNLPHAGAALAILLARQKRWDEAAQVWSTVSTVAEDKRLSDAAQLMKYSFFQGGRFRNAAEVAGELSAGGNAPAVEKVTNSGFEIPVKTEGAGEFDWRVAQGNYPQIGVTDAQKHSGRFSLITVFNNSDPKTFRGFSQIVAVQPGRTYELSVPYRADMKSKVPFHWEIVSAGDSKRIALSEPLLPLAEWTELSTSFTVPADKDGVEIRFVRGDCVAAACAATGSFWFDDISMTAK